MASIHKEGKYYNIHFRYEGKQYKRSLRTSSKQQADRIRIQIENDISAGLFNLQNYSPHNRISLSDFFDRALSYSNLNKSPKTAERDDIVYRNFLSFTGNVNLSSINLEIIEKYKLFVVNEKGNKPSTVNVELRHLSAAFSFAVELGYITTNPFKSVKKLKVPKKKPVYLTQKKAAELLELTQDRAVYPYILISLSTGARISEIVDLKWDDVDYEQNTIRLFGKGSKERIVPLPEKLRKYLEGLTPRDKFVITASRNRSEVTRQFKHYIIQIGLSKFKFHNLRDTYASWMVQKGVNLKIIQELLGHESIQTTMVYAHLAPNNRLIAQEVINSVIE